MPTVRKMAVVTTGGNVPECAVTETFLLSQEIKLCGAIGGTDFPNIFCLLAGEGGVCERGDHLVG